MPPLNDNFDDAQDLGSALAGAETVDNADATLEVGEPQPSATDLWMTIWFKWTAPSDEVMTFDTFGSVDVSLSDMDTVLAVWTGTDLTDLVEVASSDDASGTLSQVNFSATTGTVYWIQAGLFDGNTNVGEYHLNWTSGGAANDNFADAIELPSVASYDGFPGSNVGATVEVDEPVPSAVVEIALTVWFKWTAPSDGFVAFNTFDSDFNTILAAYTGLTLADLVEVASNDNYGFSQQSLVQFPVTAGTTYYIQVGGSNESAFGFIALSWSTTDTPTIPADQGWSVEWIRFTARGIHVLAGQTNVETPGVSQVLGAGFESFGPTLGLPDMDTDLGFLAVILRGEGAPLVPAGWTELYNYDFFGDGDNRHVFLAWAYRSDVPALFDITFSDHIFDASALTVMIRVDASELTVVSNEREVLPDFDAGVPVESSPGVNVETLTLDFGGTPQQGTVFFYPQVGGGFGVGSVTPNRAQLGVSDAGPGEVNLIGEGAGLSESSMAMGAAYHFGDHPTSADMVVEHFAPPGGDTVHLISVYVEGLIP